MKKIIKFLMVIATTSFALAHADGGSISEYTGSSSALIGYVGHDGGYIALGCNPVFLVLELGIMCADAVHQTEIKSGGFQVPSSLVVRTWGEGKIVVSYSTSSVEDCSGIQRNFVGFETAFETYNLYSYTQNPLNIDPTKAQPDASLQIFKNVAQLQLFKNLDANSIDSDGRTCTWKINSDATLNFQLSSPDARPMTNPNLSSYSPYDNVDNGQ